MANFTTVAAVKGWAGITSSADDVAIRGVIASVSGLLAGIVGHDFDGTPIVGETHAGSRIGAILLEKPAESIEEVREFGDVIDPTDYALDQGRMLYRVEGGQLAHWAIGRRAVEVDYTPVSQVPADLELAAREVSAWIWKQSGRETGSSRLGLSAQANADTGTADYFAQALRQLPVTNTTLRRYKRYA